MTRSLPESLEREVVGTIETWENDARIRRLWDRDATLWTGSDESRWLGWLDAAEDPVAGAALVRGIGDATRGMFDRGEISDVLLLGMGGSSLCAEVMAETFGSLDGRPRLRVLDSTVPAQVLRLAGSTAPETTLHIVSSKSGTTLEPNLFLDYFHERTCRALGDAAGKRFIAITDPGSALERLARKKGFREVFHGVPSIGGRYSALSAFGLVPAAIMGLDTEDLLLRARRMARACAAEPAAENPGLILGAVLGTAASRGRDKVTFVTSPGLAGLGAWLEQLLAESTGKNGRGLIPVDGETVGSPDRYGEDRLFIGIRLLSDPASPQDDALEALSAAGHPVVRIVVTEREDLGAEFFRWEFATAVAGAILGINPFDQPDVEASKEATRRLTGEYESTGGLPRETPFHEEGGIALHADPETVEILRGASEGAPSLAGYLRAHLDRIGPGDYFALLAYIDRDPDGIDRLQKIRQAVRDSRRAATCVGFGPRFLHSTGQAYKGGPGSGVFLQVTTDDPEDAPIPGRPYTFGVVKSAQALGDLAVLVERGRRTLRVHLRDPVDGFKTFIEIVLRATVRA